MGQCSPILFKSWWDKRFGDLCDRHDAAWKTRRWKDKVSADFVLCGEIAARGYTLLSYATFAYLVVATIYWMWKKWRA